MDMETLKIFQDVWKTGNITNAANIHFITQSALSRKIALLEKELGVQLFQRGKGRPQVELTPAGQAFVDIAERMLILYEQALELKQEEQRHFLTIACIQSAHDYLLPLLLNNLRVQRQDFCVTLEDHHTAEIFSLVENRRVDLGIAQEAAPFSDLVSELLYAEEYQVVMGASGGSQSILLHPNQLSPEHGIFQAFDQEFQEWYECHWGLFSAKIRVNTTQTAEKYFTEPDDWMIVPALVAKEMQRKGFRTFSFVSEVKAPHHHAYLIYRKKAQPPALIEFLSIVRQSFQDSSRVWCGKNKLAVEKLVKQK